MDKFKLTNNELSNLGKCVVCETEAGLGKYGESYPVCIECYQNGKLREWQFKRLIALLEELEEHAKLYGSVPRSADKLWRRVREAIAEEKPIEGV